MGAMDMKILEAQRLRRSLYRLTLDSGEELPIDKRTFDESPYRVGGQIDAEQLAALAAQSVYNRAHDTALYWLGQRDLSGRELEKKLAAGETPPEVASAVVERLRQVGLLDDAAYARRAARSLAQYKQYPRRRVEQELLRRGIDRQTAREAVEETDSDDFQQALALVRKKYYNKLTDRDLRQKTVAALARRGYPFEVARRAVETAAQEQTDAEETDEEWL